MSSLSRLQARTRATGFAGQIERTKTETSNGVETVQQVRDSMQIQIERLEAQLKAARRRIAELEAEPETFSYESISPAASSEPDRKSGRWVTPKEACRILCISQATISRAIRGVGSGSIQSREIGGGDKTPRYMVNVDSYVPASHVRGRNSK